MRYALPIFLTSVAALPLYAEDVPDFVNPASRVTAYEMEGSLDAILCGLNDENGEAALNTAQKLLEQGAEPDGNNGDLFCRIPDCSYKAEAQLLLLQYGNQNYAERTKNWRICMHRLDPGVIYKLLEGGVDPNSWGGEKGMTLLGIIVRRGYGAHLVKLAIEKGATVKPSKQLKHYFCDYTFIIRVDNNVHPEDSAEVMRLLLDAGADIDALNRSGESLRIYYGKKKTAAARAIGEVLRERGAKLHPDAPRHKK